MYAEIIPYGASFHTEALTYAVGDSFRFEIQIGQLVKIPYGKKIISGVIADIFYQKNTEIEEIKFLESIVYPKPILCPYQIACIKKISRKYLLPIHRVLSIFLSTPLLRRMEKYQFLGENYEKKRQEIHKFHEKNSWHDFEKTLPKDPHHFKKNFTKNAIFFAKNSCIDFTSLAPFLQEKTAIIVPDDIFLEQIRPFFPKNLTLFLSHEMTDAQRSASWIDLYFGKYPLAVWSRKMIFANLGYYEHIFYLEDSFFREYTHYPVHINYNDILSYIVDSDVFSCTIFTSIPRLDTLSRFHFFQLHHL